MKSAQAHGLICYLISSTYSKVRRGSRKKCKQINDSVRPVFPITRSAASVGRAANTLTSNRCFMLSFLVVISWIVSSKSRLLPEGKLTRDASSSTFAVLSLLQNACKMCMWLFWLPSVSDFVFFTTLCGVTVFICCFHIKSQAHRADFIIPGVDLRRRVIKNIKMSLYTL